MGYMIMATAPNHGLFVTAIASDRWTLARTSLALQAMPIRHRDAARDAADNADEALVGTADKEVFQMRVAIELFLRRAVDCAVVVAGKTHDRCRREHIGI